MFYEVQVSVNYVMGCPTLLGHTRLCSALPRALCVGVTHGITCSVVSPPLKLEFDPFFSYLLTRGLVAPVLSSPLPPSPHPSCHGLFLQPLILSTAGPQKDTPQVPSWGPRVDLEWTPPPSLHDSFVAQVMGQGSQFVPGRVLAPPCTSLGPP